MMRLRICSPLAAATLLLLVAGCSTMSSVVRGAAGRAAEDAVHSAATAPGGSLGGPVDFKPDEILASLGEGDLLDRRFRVAKVLTPASPATKDQAEVLLVKDGSKHWSSALIPSHRAAKEELSLGQVVFCNSYQDYEEVTDDRYRKASWSLGRISSVDELFKNVVEINGREARLQWIRVPDRPVE